MVVDYRKTKKWCKTHQRSTQQRSSTILYTTSTPKQSEAKKSKKKQNKMTRFRNPPAPPPPPPNLKNKTKQKQSKTARNRNGNVAQHTKGIYTWAKGKNKKTKKRLPPPAHTPSTYQNKQNPQTLTLPSAGPARSLACASCKGYVTNVDIAFAAAPSKNASWLGNPPKSLLRLPPPPPPPASAAAPAPAPALTLWDNCRCCLEWCRLPAACFSAS